MSDFRLLLIDRFPENMLEKLRLLPVRVDYKPEWRREEVIVAMPETDILVMNSKVKVDAELLAQSPRLQLLCRAGVGMDHFDLPLLAERGVKVFNTPGANAIPVAEQTLGSLLSLLHNVNRSDRQVRQFSWKREENRGFELFGATVGIIGYGNTGSEVGKRLQGFGCKVLAYDKYKSGFAPGHVEECQPERIFEEADILTLHVPLTDETHHLFDAAYLAQFKKPVWLLNLARGPVVDPDALIEGLASGKVLGAALDVLENEKFATLSPVQKSRLETLMDNDRVIFTPHIGGWSHGSLQRINDRIVAEVARWLETKS